MMRSVVVAIMLLAAMPAAAQSVTPAGAAACSGCHPRSAAAGAPITPLASRPAQEIVEAMRPSALAHVQPRSWTASPKALPTRKPAPLRPGSASNVEVAMRAAPSRRNLLGGALAASAALMTRPSHAQGLTRVVVIGGGFAGATCARDLQRSGLAVTLAEPNPLYTACPFSNEVIAGLRPFEAQRFGYDALRAEGVTLAPHSA